MIDQNNSLWIPFALAFLQIAVVIWQGGKLSQRIEHLEGDFSSLKNDFNSLRGEVNTVKLDLTNLKSEVSFIKGMLSGWKNGSKEE
jgi:hypothetical protein